VHTENTSIRPGKIFVFSAPSGAGKNTLLNFIHTTAPGCVYSISATTRAPRPGEKDGVHYFFLSEQEFKEWIQTDKFAEWEIVHGHYYGTPREFIDTTITSGKHVLMDIDVYGKKKFDSHYPAAIGILILPPSISELEKRLRQRGTENEQTIHTRLTNATNEMAFAEKEGKYEYRIINDDLETAKKEVYDIVMTHITPQHTP
jgi:guanylate kinase